MQQTQLDPLFIAFQGALAGRYSLDRELGRGGMGIVYLARDVNLDRPVAIKLLPPDKAKDAALRERFLREARTAAKLSHPNIIPIHAVEELTRPPAAGAAVAGARDAGGHFVFFAMAYVDGETLTERVRRRGPLPASEAARVLREVAWGLAHAHAHGLVHRDVKPDNILLEGAAGRALVADFGIASGSLINQGPAGVSQEINGTPEFMSPEQALGEATDHRSDVYSLGATAFFALAGKLPFEGATATEVLAKQVTEAPPTLASVAPTVPRRLAQTVDRCLAKDPAARPTSADAFAEQLGRALEQRREMPLALRAFVKHGARIDGVGTLFYPSAVLFGTVLLSELLHFGVRAGFLTFFGGMALGPLAFLANRARRLLRSGFDHGDLGVAFKAEMERGREERAAAVGSSTPSLLERLTRYGFYVSSGVAVTSLALLVGPFPAFASIGPLLGIAAATATALGIVSLAQLQRRRDVDTEFWSKLWTGRVGKLLFRVARAITPRRQLPTAMTHRPTELGISMAAEQLYETLPKATRAQLAEVPDVLKTLEQDARITRLRLTELQDALAGVEPDAAAPAPPGEGAAVVSQRNTLLTELGAERDEAQRRLQKIVAAMETIRLHLLRLHAGTGSVQSFTTDLGSALDVAHDIELQVAARDEVEAVLKRV